MRIVLLILVCLQVGCCQVMDRDSFIRVVHEKDAEKINALWYLGSFNDSDVFVLCTLMGEQRFEVRPSVVETCFSMEYVGDDRYGWKLIKPNGALAIDHLSKPDSFWMDTMLASSNVEYRVIEEGTGKVLK